MKLQIKKIVSLFACICVALSVMAVAPFAADTQVVFNFGANGTASHNDGTDIGTSKSWTEGEYTLTLTNASKVFGGARDAKGNSALKLGTSKVDGTFKMVAPENVTSVIFKVAKYKTNAISVQINGVAQTVNTASDNGEYTDLVIDTTTTKEITFLATGSKHRCMIDAIVYVIGDTTGGNGGAGEGGNEGGNEGGEGGGTPSTPTEIVDAAYNLAAGAKITGVTLTGKVTEIVEEFSSQYGNITVKFVIEGKEDKPLNCKRMVVTDATTVEVGDTITVEGDIENNTYQGTTTFQFYKPTLKNVVKASGGNQGGNQGGGTPSTPAEIVDAAYALTGSNKLMGVTLTGKVKEVTGAFDPSYSSITVDIVVEGKEDKPIECKYMTVTGETQVEVGDTITVEGNIEKYNSKVQFYKPTLKNVVKASGGNQGGNEGGGTPSTPAEIVDAAYALTGSNKLMGVTLTGKVKEVTGAFDPSYSSITVDIVVEGKEDKPIECKYMTVTGETQVEVGDTITVEGNIEKYNSKVQFYKPTLKNVVKASGGNQGGNEGGSEGGSALPAPDATNTLTIPQAIALAEAQEAGQYAADKYYVTGKITDIANTKYGNMYIADDANNSIYVYGVYSADGEALFEALDPQPKVGDTITIYCQVGKYNSTIQLKSGWLQKLVEGTGEGSGSNDPAADSVLTVKQAIDLALSKRHDIYTANKYYVTGTITEIYNEQFGNMKITDAEGNILTLYGTYDEDGNRFDAMTNKPQVGDEITIYGIIGQYNGTAQVKDGVFKAVPAGGNQGGNQGGNAGDNNQGSGSINNGGANSGNTGSNDSNKAPVTGDNMGFIACLIALVLSGAALVVTKKFARN